MNIAYDSAPEAQIYVPKKCYLCNAELTENDPATYCATHEEDAL